MNPRTNIQECKLRSSYLYFRSSLSPHIILSTFTVRPLFSSGHTNTPRFTPVQNNHWNYIFNIEVLHRALDGDWDHEQKDNKMTVERYLYSARTSQRTLSITQTTQSTQHVKCPSLLSHFNQNLKEKKKSRNYTKNDHTKFRGICTCGKKASRSVRTHRETNGHCEDTSRSSQLLCERP
jgi:hypothetical protein